MKSKLETAARDVLLVVDTGDLLHRERAALYALQEAVKDPWYAASASYPSIPQGVSHVEVLGFVADSDPPLRGCDFVEVVTFWRAFDGVQNVWTVSTTDAKGEPYDALVDVTSWHPIPSRAGGGT